MTSELGQNRKEIIVLQTANQRLEIENNELRMAVARLEGELSGVHNMNEALKEEMGT